MAKEVNIKVKVADAEEAKRVLESVGIAVRDVGDKTAQTGTKSGGALDAMNRAWSSIHSLLLGGIAGALAGAALKVAQFFDSIKTKSDEAVRNLRAVHAEMAGIFEEMDAFTRESQDKTRSGFFALLKETGVPKSVGIPVYEEYVRQFKDQMPQAQFDQGAKEMLGYAARHGAPAAVEMIKAMPGWGIKTPEQMGEFRRMVTAGADMARIEESELLLALGKGAPTIRAMGWSPQQAIATFSALAAGETGRERTALPSQVFEALVQPVDVKKLKEYGISEQFAESPQQLFAAISMKAQSMDRKTAFNMLQDIYGSGAAAGMYKYMNLPIAPFMGRVEDARGPVGAAAEAAKESGRLGTVGGALSQAEAIEAEHKQKIKDDELFMAAVRIVGAGIQEENLRERPIVQRIKDLAIIGNQAEREYAVFEEWAASLSEDERRLIIEEMQTKYGKGHWQRSVVEQMALEQKWELFPAEEKFRNALSVPMESNTTQSSNVNINYNHNVIFQSRVGPDTTGPRVSNDIK